MINKKLKTALVRTCFGALTLAGILAGYNYSVRQNRETLLQKSAKLVESAKPEESEMLEARERLGTLGGSRWRDEPMYGSPPQSFKGTHFYIIDDFLKFDPNDMSAKSYRKTFKLKVNEKSIAGCYWVSKGLPSLTFEFFWASDGIRVHNTFYPNDLWDDNDVNRFHKNPSRLSDTDEYLSVYFLPEEKYIDNINVNKMAKIATDKILEALLREQTINLHGDKNEK